jgi:hypothetical protein
LRFVVVALMTGNPGGARRALWGKRGYVQSGLTVAGRHSHPMQFGRGRVTEALVLGHARGVGGGAVGETRRLSRMPHRVKGT